MESERARELLAAERRRLEGELAGIAPQDSGEETDAYAPGNRASELYQEELDEGRADDLRRQLAAVQRAERRLAAGTFGRSVRSGEPIPDARLEAEPTAELTVEEERTGR